MATNNPYPETPTLDKRKEVAEESQAIGRFLDWLGDEKRFSIGGYVHTHRRNSIYETSFPTHDQESIDRYCDFTHESTKGQCWIGADHFIPISQGFNALLHEYFGIDPEKEDEEMKAVLEHIRQTDSLMPNKGDD